MTDVLIDSQPYDSYGGVEEGDFYFAAATHAANWTAASELVKGQALVTASRILNRQQWKGDKYEAAQPLAWPRANTGIDGVEDTVIPTPIVEASFELALSLLDGSTVQTNPEAPQEQKTSSLKAGSVSISYFKGAVTPAELKPGRFPLIVEELLKPYLGGDTTGLVSEASGVDACSVTEQDFGFTRGF